ncbi:YqhA family protein [Halomonas sp. BM-2019]|uniref:YqhA family protein n=1 Tax=Halomonas sp. BM-2019 TaxID=2811227 RepID=UPI001B3C2F6B|nr:MAG: YqhA family protein [Halomonas sp. BM-2019]
MERLLRSSGSLAYVTVLIALISAVVLYTYAILLIGHILFSAIKLGLYNWEAARESAVALLKVWDLLLIAASFQIMSTGTYKLFLNPDARQIGPVSITSFDDLKYVLVSLVIVVLIIIFLEHAIKLGPGRELLEFGAAISLVIVAGGWMIRKKDSNARAPS